MLVNTSDDKAKLRETDGRTEKDAFSGKVMKTIIIFWVITIPIALFFAWGFSKMLLKIGK